MMRPCIFSQSNVLDSIDILTSGYAAPSPQLETPGVPSIQTDQGVVRTRKTTRAKYLNVKVKF